MRAMYKIVRRNGDNYQILYDRFQKNGSGEWRAPGEGVIDIPLQFDSSKKAFNEMQRAIEAEPWWDYKIEEYLR